MVLEKTTLLGGQMVDKKHVDELVGNYKKTRWIFNTDRLGKPDSLSSWFNLGALSGFMQRAREENADGIRVCFGVYPDNFEAFPEYSGRQTVVLVATRKKLNSTGQLVQKDVYIQDRERTEILAFNFSHICPPNCTNDSPDGDYGISILQQGNGMIVI